MLRRPCRTSSAGPALRTSTPCWSTRRAGAFRGWLAARLALVERGFHAAHGAAQPALLEMFAGAYAAWPVKSDVHPEPQHPESEAHVTDSLAKLMANLPGGLDKLYKLSQARFPRQTLALKSGDVLLLPRLDSPLASWQRSPIQPDVRVDQNLSREALRALRQEGTTANGLVAQDLCLRRAVDLLSAILAFDHKHF